MPYPSFDFCILGNGPLGAAAAAHLAGLGATVCLVGARPAERWSGHQDHSRLYRTLHQDAYWTRLAQANLPLMQALGARTGIHFLRPAPVYYDQRVAGACAQGHPSTSELIATDPCGGVLDPLAYIAALNQQAQAWGADLRADVASIGRWLDGQHEVAMAANGTIRCRHLMDFRGFYAMPTPGGATIARTTLLVRHPPQHRLHGFIRTELDNPDVAEFFACCELEANDELQTSKFVIADARSVLLESTQALQDWFTGGFSQHPQLPWAVEEIRRMGYDIHSLHLAPCAFTRTPSGRPEVRVSQNHLRFYGCNGSAAKCAQSLARDVIEPYLGACQP